MTKKEEMLKKIAKIIVRNEKTWHKLSSAYGEFWARKDEIDKSRYFKLIKKLCKVKKVEGYRLKRIGGNNDGAYIMIDDFEHSKVAYSFGIADNVQWDECIADKEIDVYCYDHTIEGLPKENARLHFNKIGIAGTDREEESLLSLESIMRKNHHEGIKNAILKMDVEGAEWEFLESVPLDLLGRFSQITLELHDLYGYGRHHKQVIKALKRLSKTHQAVWIHGNNASPVACIKGIEIPYLLEITWANKKKYSFKETVYNCPTDIDEPNCIGIPDIVLKNW